MLSHAHFPQSRGAHRKGGMQHLCKSKLSNVLKSVHEANLRQQNPRVGCCYMMSHLEIPEKGFPPVSILRLLANVGKCNLCAISCF